MKRTGRYHRLRDLWPQGPLGVLIALTGLLNVLVRFRLPLAVLQRSQTLTGLAESLSAVGGTAQVILGVLLIVGGIFLFWRAIGAWVIAVFLLVIAVGIDVARSQWGPGLALEAILLISLLFFKDRFTRRTRVAGIVFSLIGVLAVLAFGLFGSYLLGGGFRPQIRDFGTALYFTIVTLSTVGYGDIVPVTPEARVFVIFLLVVGLGVFASTIASALGPKIAGEFNRFFKPKERPMELKDHVILVGEGTIARNTAEELKRRQLPFVQIVSIASAAEAAAHRVIEGDASNEGVLREAGIQHARMIVAAREDDGENAFIVLGAKELNPGVKVLAVASSGLSIRRLKLARADLVFSPVAVGTRLLADLVQGIQIAPEFEDLLEGHPKKP